MDLRVNEIRRINLPGVYVGALVPAKETTKRTKVCTTVSQEVTLRYYLIIKN